SEVVSILENAGHEVTLLTAANILDHELLTINFDVFVMINNLPRENIAPLVQDFWLGGGGVLSFNSGISFLFYYGLLAPELEGTDPAISYWQYLPAADINISSRHPVTQEYQISDSISERPRNWVTFWVPYWDTYSSIVERDVKILMNNITLPDHGYGVAIDSHYRGGKVVQLPGDGYAIPSDFNSIITNAVEWLVPAHKGRIAYDLSHQPRLCINEWDEEFATIYVETNSFSQLRNSLVNRSFTFDKFYPSPTANFSSERLSHYDLIVLDWPDINYTASEKVAIEEWVSTGGSLLVLGDRLGLIGGGPGIEYINFLLDDFGMELSDSDILTDVTASQAADHPTLEGCTSLGISYRNHITITEAVVDPIWDDGGIIVVAAQQYSQGRVVLFSDMNILDNGHLGLYDNERYAVNLVNWLTANTAEILLYTSTGVTGSYYRSPVVNALNELSLEFHLTYTTDYLTSLLSDETWALVIVDDSNVNVEAAYSALTTYVDMGGRLLMSTYNMDGNSTSSLWAELGVAFVEEWDNDEPAYIWDTSHSIFTSPISYGATTLVPSGLFFDDGDKVHVLNGATSLAGITATESENNTAIVLANKGRTLLNTFLLSGLLNDYDDSTYRDADEIWLNQIAFMNQAVADPPFELPLEPEQMVLIGGGFVFLFLLVLLLRRRGGSSRKTK
ncbi:MAG: DUF4350 domain-containing protein, partial [Candidatus Hodarchaeales archaeon]